MFLSLLMMGCVVVGQADESKQDDAEQSRLRAEVRKLVQQLDSDQIDRREAAEKELIELGPEILDFLPRITPRTPAEVKTRLQRVRKAMEVKSAEAATNASIVTLKGKMKLSEALASIEKQTANQIVDLRNRFGQQESDVELDLDLEKLPFWSAFDRLLDKAGLTVYSYSTDGELGIISRPDTAVDRFGNAVYSGLFRFEPLTIEATRQLRAQSSDMLRLKVEVAWEPRSRPIAVSQSYDAMTALGEDGKEIEIGNEGGKFEISVNQDAAAAEVVLPMSLPSRDVKRISSFKGQLMALVPGRAESFEFENLAARGEEQERAGVVVVLEQVRKNLDLYELRMRVRYAEAGDALESHRGWVYQNQAYLVGPDGRQVENSGLQATLTANNEVGLSYLFEIEDNLKDYKFVYKTPALILKLPIDYEFKDIALP